MTFHFDCIFYYVSDLQRAIRFYSDVLGLKFVSQDVVARFDVDGVLFEIVPCSDKTRLQQGGNARLCLQVEDVEKALQELQSRGVRTCPPQNKGQGVLGCFEDPDGNQICLWQFRDPRLSATEIPTSSRTLVPQ